MRARSVRSMTMVACLALAATAFAQFGHPLKGQWSGDWGTNKDNRTRVLLDIQWDGKQLTSVLNPGATSVKMRQTSLDPATWGVHLEGEGKDASGATTRYVIDGKMENIGAYARFITGTWVQGNLKGDFRLTRN